MYVYGVFVRVSMYIHACAVLLCLRANVCLKSSDLLQHFQVNILSRACGYLFQCVEEVCEGG